MEIVVDLTPEIISLLDYHRAAFGADRSAFLNYLIALYDQNTRQHHQQQPSRYIGSVAGLAPVEPIPQKQFTLRGTKAQVTVMRSKSKTVPKRTAQKKLR